MFEKNVGGRKIIGVDLTFCPSTGDPGAVSGVLVDFSPFTTNFDPDEGL